MAALSILLFGSFQANLNDETITTFRSSKVRALLIIAAAEQSDAHKREDLIGLLWPGMPKTSARQNLRQTLYHLRQTIPEVTAVTGAESVPLLLTNRQTIQLNPAADVDLDTTTFDELIQETHNHDHLELLTCHFCRERLETAVALYRGDFLADFSLEDSDIFEHWAAEERDAFRRQMLDALDTVTAILMGQQSYKVARSYAERQLEIDPLRESAYRQSMEILARSGQREEALAVYQRGRRLFWEELSMAPTARTTTLYEQIKAGDLSLALPHERGIRGYELRAEIGAGAYGAVHIASQPGVGREVAVKVILPQYANDPDFIRRFETEAQTVARLEHPFIVPLYDYWREPDGAYLVMRYLRGGNLQSAIADEPWSPRQAVKMVEQIASALIAAHRQGVIHRDLKPANILLDEEGNAYLSDFGIAKRLVEDSQMTLEGAIIGTPDYISPEQILSESLGPQTDQYSLGAVLYETLTGDKPFSDASVATLLHKHLNDPLPLVTASRPGLSPKIDTVIQRATAKKAADRYADALALAAALRQAVGEGEAIRLTPVSTDLIQAAKVAPNPYKGLAAFQEADAKEFFGREALVARLVDALRNGTGQGAAGRFLAVVGPSGSGKSSAVRAGLIPALRRGAVSGSEKWFVAEMIPGTHPLEELEAALLRVAVNPPPSLLEPLERDERGLLRTVKRVLPDEPGGQLLLVIDQFEELFALVEDEGRREHFLSNLVTAITEPRSPLRLVITIRADFYDRPLQFPPLGELLQQFTELVLPLSQAELEQAVRAPASGAGVALEQGLLAAITADVNEQPGALPLLQYALTELYERRQGRVMTLAAYKESGGVTGALGRRAEAIYAALDPDGRADTRQLFLRLVTLGEGVEDTRRRVLRSELEMLGASNQRPTTGHSQLTTDHRSLITGVLDAFGEGRLLTFDHDQATRGPTVEVAHEALLREWLRLRSWLDESRNDVRQLRLLDHAAAEWLRAGRDAGFLLRGSRLDQFEAWTAETDLASTADELAFMAASLEERRLRQLEEVARQAHEAVLERRNRNFLRALVGVFAVAAVIAIVLTIFAFGQQNAAEESEALAQSNAATATVAQGEAVLQADLAATSEAEAQEQRVVAEEQKAVAEEEALARATAQGEAETQRSAAEAEARAAQEAYSLSLAANAREALANGDAELALLLSLAANRIPSPPLPAQRALMDAAYAPGTSRQMETNSLNQAVAPSPDGERILSGSEDGILRLWDTESGDLLQEFEGHTSGISDLAISPNGKQALSSSSDRKVILWDLESGKMIHQMEGHDTWARAVAFAPDGQKALSGADTANSPGELILWDLETGNIIRRFGDTRDGNREGVRSIAITPDGRFALVGVAGQTDDTRPLVLWDLETFEVVRFFEGVSRSVNSVAISADGRTGLSGSADDLVRLWDLETGEELQRLEGHEGIVVAVAFSPDGRTALSGDLDGVIIHWDLDNGSIIERLSGHQSSVWDLSFVGDERAVSASYDTTLRLWDLTSQWRLARWDGGELEHGAPVVGIAISPDGRYALTGSELAGGSLSPEEQNLLILWDYETGQSIRSLAGHESDVTSIAFTHNSKRALTGSLDKTLILWDLETGQPIYHMEGHELGINSVAISSDDTYALSASSDGTAILWYLPTGAPLRSFVGHQRDVWDVAFGPDDSWAVSSSYDCSLIVWDIASGRQLRRLTGLEGDIGGTISGNCGINGISLSPDGQRVLSATDDGTLLLWDLASGRSLRRFTGHGDTPWSVAIGPNGDRAFSGGQDKNLILWDMETGTSIHNYEGADSYGPYGVDKYETEVTISPDGETAISGEPDGTVLKWQLTEPSMADLVTWIGNNRYLRELTCQERSVYQIQPLCDEKDQTTATTADLLMAVHEVVIALPEATDPLRSTGPAKPLITLSTIMNPAQILHIGQNRGQLSTNEIDVWNYTGTAGEILSLQMVADQPVDTYTNDLAIIEERIATGQLDAVLIVIDPEGKPIGMNIESFTDDGEFNSDAILDVALSMDGEYQIQARSERDFYGGDYTLVVESKLFTMDPETLASFAGEWYEEESGLTIVYTVGDGRLTYEVSNGYAGYIVFVSEVEFLDPVFPFKGVYTLDETGYPVESIITWPFDGSTSHTYRVEE